MADTQGRVITCKGTFPPVSVPLSLYLCVLWATHFAVLIGSGGGLGTQQASGNRGRRGCAASGR